MTFPRHLSSLLGILCPILILLLASGLNANAHPGHSGAMGIAPGLLHPLSGLDHILAMIAVGLWAAQIGGRAIWAVPLTFVGTMVLGGILGMTGVAVPFVEQGILVSIFLLGLMIAFAVSLPLSATAPLVSLFAIFHGYAHGAEAPESASGLLYAAGFVLSTAFLHGCGILLALAIKRVAGVRLIRLGGVAILALGGFFAATSTSNAEDLPKNLKAVVDPYLAISASLSTDSFKGVPEQAAALNQAVTLNPKQYTPDLVKEAADLSRAKDIAAARSALKPLSASLIALLAAQKVHTGAIHEAVCPMSGSWLQTDAKKVHNPYGMGDCGDIKRAF